jgi:hypothetical protein
VWIYVNEHFVPWIVNELRRVGHDIRNWTETAIHWAAHQLANVWSHFIAALRWVERDLIAPLLRQVTHFILWFGRTAWHLIFDAIHAVEHFAHVVARDLDNLAKQIFRWFDKTFWDWWHTLVRWGEELLRFLASPFEWLGAHLQRFVTQGARWFIEQIIAAASREGSMVEEFLARWLGS